MSKSNTTLTLKEVLKLVVQSAIESNLKTSNTTGTAISDITDIQKKNTTGNVVDSNNTTGIINIDIDGTVYTINANIEGGIIKIPVKDSGVEVGFDSENKPYIIDSKFNSLIAISVVEDADYLPSFISVEQDSISLITGSNDKNGTLTNYGGLIIIEELTKKLNDLVSEVNSLKTYINTHIHTSAAAGSPTTPPTTPSTQTFNQFNKNDFENTTITHGVIK